MSDRSLNDPRWVEECTCGHRRRAHATVREVEVACVFCDCRLFTLP